MDWCTCAIELEPCSTAAAWLCACSATWSTDAVSSSTEALVSSSVDAWLCAPSASFCALAVICSLEEATCSALSWMRCHHGLQLHRHPVQRRCELADLVLLVDGKLPGEVTRGHQLGEGDALREGLGDAAGEQQVHEEGHDDRRRGDHQDEVAKVMAGARYSTSGMVIPTLHPVVVTGANPAVFATPLKT